MMNEFSYFFQIFGLIVLMLLSWLLVSLIFMLVPVFLGRQIFALWFDENPRVYELYTSAMGLYTCLLLIRGATLFAGWVQQGWLQLSQKLREWAAIVSIFKRRVVLVTTRRLSILSLLLCHPFQFL